MPGEPMTRPRWRRSAVVLAFVALLGAAACTGGGGGDEPDPSPSATASAAPLPDGWTRESQDGLSFGLPEGFRRSSGGATEEGTQTTYTAADGSDVPARIDVFTEEGQVGSLEIRVGLLVARVESELGATVEGPDDVEVAGATAAQEFSYTYTLPEQQGGDEIRQVDLLVDREGLPKYGIRYAAAADEFDDQVWEDLVTSLTVGDAAQDG